MAVSPLQSFPIPNLSDPANVPSDMSLLAGAVEKKVVMTFASAAAREAAIAAPVEGMVAYLNDTNAVTLYDGTVWREWVDSSLQTYTPALTAGTTNPTLGTGSAVFGRFVRQGRMVTVWVRILFGTSGVAAGSGAYFVSLPATASTITGSSGGGGGQAIGSGHFRDNSAVSSNNVLSVQLRDATSVMFVTGAGGAVTEAAPITWAAEDVITFTASYPIA